MSMIVFGTAMLSFGVFVGIALMAFLRPKFICFSCGEQRTPYACDECSAWLAEQAEKEGA